MYLILLPAMLLIYFYHMHLLEIFITSLKKSGIKFSRTEVIIRMHLMSINGIYAYVGTAV